MPIPCAIIGTGPAALTAATFLTRAGIKPVLFERRRAPGWKLLVAGSSGLNITYDCPAEELPGFYSLGREEIAACLQRFTRDDWLKLLRELGEEPYVGSSRRYFLKNKTAAVLLGSWTESLEAAGASFVYGEELAGLEAGKLHFHSGRVEEAQTTLLALGGGSWDSEPTLWPEMLRALHVKCADLEPSNAGFSLVAPHEFFEKAEGQPVKGLLLTTARGQKQGELMITKYGLEGTPIYTVGCPGTATLDLKPDLAESKLAERLTSSRGTSWQRVQNSAKLSTGAELLLQQFAPRSAWDNPASAAHAIKNLKVELLASRPLSESISARGGVAWEELGKDLELKRLSGVFCAGEMINWDAPTGGFLIQACVSTGFVAAEGIVRKLSLG